MSNNNSPWPIIAVGALGLSSVSCAISSLTGFLVSDDSNVESNTSTDTSNTNTDTSNTNTDTSNTSTDTSNTSTDTSNTSTSNTSTSNTYTIPHQIDSGMDGWCWSDGITVHQDVPGCGRICSSAINVGSKEEGTWGPWADTNIACNGAKLDEIWEVQDDGTRKLADGYITSKWPEGILYYGGDSNLGRDGRNACNMTDDDKKYACDNDTELVGIGSGHTCGHKFYNTDQGTGSVIASTDEYSKFYSCDTKAYV